MKTHAPKDLQDWWEDNKELNHSYSDLLGTKAHAALKKKLIEEQGKLCAYTGLAITPETSHIEHLKPQNCCGDGEDVDYRNVVACFPINGGDTTHGYGAPVKRGWWEEDKFVSPLSEECERRFRFTWTGSIQPFPDGHEAARKTISVLGLDHDTLNKLRRAHIRGFFGLGGRAGNLPLSVADARRALGKIDQPDAEGQRREFCFVLKQLLPKYIDGGGAQ